MPPTAAAKCASAPAREIKKPMLPLSAEIAPRITRKIRPFHPVLDLSKRNSFPPSRRINPAPSPLRHNLCSTLVVSRAMLPLSTHSKAEGFRHRDRGRNRSVGCVGARIRACCAARPLHRLRRLQNSGLQTLRRRTSAHKGELFADGSARRCMCTRWTGIATQTGERKPNHRAGFARATGRIRHTIPQHIPRLAARFWPTRKLDESSIRDEETLAIPYNSRIDLMSQTAFLPRRAVSPSYNH